MLKATAIITSAAFLLTGCSTASKDIAAASVSPLQYSNYDCEQLQAEAHRLSGKITQLGGRLDEAANNDKAIMGVGMVLFWPALFALGGTKAQEAEFARVKGEYDALQQAAIQKKCTIQMQTTSPAQPAPTGSISAMEQPTQATAESQQTAGRVQ